MAVLDTVKAIAPALTASMTDAEITVFIELAQDTMSPEVWGTRLYPIGLAYLTAHLLALTSRGNAGGGSGASGPVTMEQAGRVLVQYAQTSSGGAGGGLDQTPYGMYFMQLRKKLPGVRPFTTGFKVGNMSGRGDT